MTRRLLNLLTAVSLLMCVAVAVLWVRSYWVSDWLNYVRPETDPAESTRVTDLYLLTENGTASALLTIHNVHRSPTEAPVSGIAWWTDTPQAARHLLGTPQWSRLRFAYDRVVSDDGTLIINGGTYYHWGVSFPLWTLALFLLLLPAIRLHRRLRSRYATGLCPACGYDLRATPDRCPECGTAATPA